MVTVVTAVVAAAAATWPLELIASEAAAASSEAPTIVPIPSPSRKRTKGVARSHTESPSFLPEGVGAGKERERELTAAVVAKGPLMAVEAAVVAAVGVNHRRSTGCSSLGIERRGDSRLLLVPETAAPLWLRLPRSRII